MSKATQSASYKKGSDAEESVALTAEDVKDVNANAADEELKDVHTVAAAEAGEELHDGCIVLGDDSDKSKRYGFNYLKIKRVGRGSPA